MYVVSYSPLVKIFQKSFTVIKHVAEAEGDKHAPKKVIKEILTQGALMKNPERVFTDEEFEFTVARDSGDIKLISGKPTSMSLPAKRSQALEPDLVQWLTGGAEGNQSPETDYTGCVLLPLDGETEGAITYYLSQGKKPGKELTEVLENAQEKARELSEMRVMRAVNIVHQLLKRQYLLMKEQNQGVYNPSDSEYLCAYVLKAAEEQAAKDRDSITSNFKHLMEATLFTQGA